MRVPASAARVTNRLFAISKCRLAADVSGVSTLIVARTDADAADMLISDADERDHEFLTGERTAEGFFRSNAGIEQAIARGIAYAPYADLVWCETAEPDMDQAERFSRVALLHQGRVLAMDEPARLRTLITGRMLEVIAPGRKAADVLRRLPGVVDAQVFGERVHVTLGNGGDSAEAEFRAALASTPLASAPVRAVQPSLEDVFIARLAGAESSHA